MSFWTRQFSPYKKSLVLVIEEARDLGNSRYNLNNKLKPIIATTSTGCMSTKKAFRNTASPTTYLSASLQIIRITACMSMKVRADISSRHLKFRRRTRAFRKTTSSAFTLG